MIWISSNSNVQLQDEVTLTAVEGVFTINEWTITTTPGSNITILLQTNAVDVKNVKATDGTPYIDEINL